MFDFNDCCVAHIYVNNGPSGALISVLFLYRYCISAKVSRAVKIFGGDTIFKMDPVNILFPELYRNDGYLEEICYKIVFRT